MPVESVDAVCAYGHFCVQKPCLCVCVCALVLVCPALTSDNRAGNTRGRLPEQVIKEKSLQDGGRQRPPLGKQGEKCGED